MHPDDTADRSPLFSPLPVPPRSDGRPGLLVLAALALVVGVGIAGVSTRHADREPTTRARVVVPTTVPAFPTAVATTAPATTFEKIGFRTEDTGIGDGSFYAYLDAVNQTGTFYDFVDVDMSCYDANDALAGHALGIASNVAAGERFTVTLIFDGAASCETFRWTYDPVAY